MDLSLSQSSCEIVSDIKNLTVSCEVEDPSNISGEITSDTTETSLEVGEGAVGSSSRKTSSSGSSCEEASTECEKEQPKPKRSRKRKRKKKIAHSSAYEEPVPFTARYNKKKPTSLETPNPNLHIRFDDCGVADIAISEYNLKPRVIKALERNLALSEGRGEGNIKENLVQSDTPDKVSREYDAVVISLKPRIIKAIIV